jgi:hypothetical protein
VRGNMQAGLQRLVCCVQLRKTKEEDRTKTSIFRLHFQLLKLAPRDSKPILLCVECT